MKNYLFEPFKNDEIKTYFNKLKNNLDIYGLTMFVGRLEAYYDVIISKLQADNVELHQEAEEIAEGNKEYFEQVMELKADNKRLQDELQAVNDDYNNDHKVHDEYADGLLEEIKELKTQNERLNDYSSINGLYDEVKELQADNEELKNKLSNYNCGCKYPKELQADAEEYFENNPHETKVFYFLVGGSGCEEDGDVKGSLNCECDAVAEFDNYDGIVSGEVYK